MRDRTRGMYLAPGASQGARADCPGTDRAPGQAGTGPSVDEHLVAPESRWEVLGGARVQVSPAQPPHADRHFSIDYVLGAHLAPGFVGATDLLTRWSEDDDYATDTSVRRAGTDQATGERHLEEMAFEVAFSQRRAALAERARRLAARGVRRVFAIFVKDGTVEEWSPAEEAWRPLPLDGFIEDSCLEQPLRVRALLDAAVADEAVARALIARGHPTILEFGEERYRRGEVDGYRRGEVDGYRRGEIDGTVKALRNMLCALLAERGIALEARHRARIDGCADPALLQAWLRRVLAAENADDVLEPPASPRS